MDGCGNHSHIGTQKWEEGILKKMARTVKAYFMPLTELGYLPKKMTPGAVGCDLMSPREYIVQPQTTLRIPLDLMIQIEPGYHGQICSRSGLVDTYNVHVAAGVIDEDFRGNVCVILINHHKYLPFYVGRGMRIAQLLLYPTINAEFVEVPNPQVTPRGGKSFGSTGYW